MNPVGPRGVYDEAKRFAEALTTAYRTSHRLDAAIVRIFNIYGPRLRRDDGRAPPSVQLNASPPIGRRGKVMWCLALEFLDHVLEFTR